MALSKYICHHTSYILNARKVLFPHLTSVLSNHSKANNNFRTISFLPTEFQNRNQRFSKGSNQYKNQVIWKMVLPETGTAFRSSNSSSRTFFHQVKEKENDNLSQSKNEMEINQESVPEKHDSFKSGQKTSQTVSKRSQLKQAVKDYGGTVLIFHITMSLVSLGLFYLLVSSGLDLPLLLKNLGLGDSISRIAEGASTFVIAYAVHKVFAPVRITITLTATPLIVRRLRTMGILKKLPPTP